MILIDMPFVVMAAIVYVTGWRAFKLSDKLGINGKEVEQRKGWDRRCIIFQEFMYLLLDIACLVPLALIVLTVYRLPGLIFMMKSASKNVSSSDSDSKYDVLNVNYEFFEKGGASLNLSLCKTKQQMINERSNSTAEGEQQDQEQGSLEEDVEIIENTLCMHILGNVTPVLSSTDGTEMENTIWNMASKLFGSLMVTVCKSYLPLPFQNKKECNLTSFKQDDGSPLWIKIDLGEISIY